MSVAVGTIAMTAALLARRGRLKQGG